MFRVEYSSPTPPTEFSLSPLDPASADNTLTLDALNDEHLKDLVKTLSESDLEIVLEHLEYESFQEILFKIEPGSLDSFLEGLRRHPLSSDDCLSLRNFLFTLKGDAAPVFLLNSSHYCQAFKPQLLAAFEEPQRVRSYLSTIQQPNDQHQTLSMFWGNFARSNLLFSLVTKLEKAFRFSCEIGDNFITSACITSDGTTINGNWLESFYRFLDTKDPQKKQSLKQPLLENVGDSIQALVEACDV